MSSKHHDPKLISILEILGSHFVDVFFNHIYNSAQSSSKPGSSLTDEYTRRIEAFIFAVKNDEHSYREVVQNLHRYFQATTRYTSLTFSDFVERIVQQFVPEEYFTLMTAPEKDENLASIIADLASTLGVYVASPDMLRRIIDGHDVRPNVTIRMIQDQAITILLAKRGQIHNSFLRRLGQAKDTVSMDVVEDLKQAIRKLVKTKTSLQLQLGEAEERVLDLEEKLSAHKTREVKFRKLIDLMQSEREQGRTAAAFQAAMPPRNSHAEPPRRARQAPRAPPRPEHIAEVRDASFFDDDEEGDEDDEDDNDRAPEQYAGRFPAPRTASRGNADLRRAPPKMTDIAALMAKANEDAPEDSDTEDDDSGSDSDE